MNFEVYGLCGTNSDCSNIAPVAKLGHGMLRPYN
jgi:hypothetical protein